MKKFARIVWMLGWMLGCLIGVTLLCPPVQCKTTVHTKTDPGQNLLRLGAMTVNKKDKTVRLSVNLAIIKGILEYLLVGNEGKTYESVFKITGTKPSELNFAMILIGATPMKFETLLHLLDQPDGKKRIMTDHKESLLQIDILKNSKPVDIRQLIRDREKKTDKAANLLWVYTGGAFTKDNRYVGDHQLSYIGIWPDITAVINLFSAHRNPYRGDFGYEMNAANQSLSKEQNYEIVIRRYSF